MLLRNVKTQELGNDSGQSLREHFLRSGQRSSPNLEVAQRENQKVGPISGGWKAFLWHCQLREEIGQTEGPFSMWPRGKTGKRRRRRDERLLHLSSSLTQPWGFSAMRYFGAEVPKCDSSQKTEPTEGNPTQGLRSEKKTFKNGTRDTQGRHPFPDDGFSFRKFC